MRKNLPTILFSVIVAFGVFAMIYMYQYSNDRFVMKAVVFIAVFIIFSIVSFLIKIDHIIYSMIFFSFLNVQMTSVNTTSTNLIILFSAFVILVRSALAKGKVVSFHLIKRNSVTLPMILIIASYTLSFLFIKKGWEDHLLLYQSVICISIFIWTIVGTIREKKQIIAINKIMLTVLIVNLCFSFLFILYPEIDSIRAKALSLEVWSIETDFRVQGFSFRGESYSEYLMICALWLFTLLLRGQFNKRKTIMWIITLSTIITLILTGSRGASAVFLLGAVLFLVFSSSITLPKRIVSMISLGFATVLTFIILSSFTNKETLLSRFYEFSDKNERVGYVPQARYHTWTSSFQFAALNNFMGVGPSLASYVKSVQWRELYADESSGSVIVWPHNITLLILSTIGIYGLMSFLLLSCRAVSLRKVFRELEPALKYAYSGYLLCFIMFLIEGQKFDGALRQPDANFYFVFILIALLFTCENMINKKDSFKSNPKI